MDRGVTELRRSQQEYYGLGVRIRSAVRTVRDRLQGALGPFGDYMMSDGMFTLVKVRDHLQNYDKDPGWYTHPPGTVASKASTEDLAGTGVGVNAPVTSASAPGSNTSGPRLARVDPIPPAMKAHPARWRQRSK